VCQGTYNYHILKLIKMSLEDIFTLESMNNAFYQGSKISHWKDTTQRYQSNLLLNNINLRNDLLNGTYEVTGTTNFYLRERGKIRYIEAPSQRDRVVQKVLCQKVLVPQLTKPLIYDNYASLKGKGTTFARQRIDSMLRKFISKYGNNGYVLQVDIKKYFESIDHQVLKDMVHKRLNETNDVLDLIDYIIDTSSKSNKGLNLGSEAPQILAIYYLSPIDNYIKSVRGIKYYGRYMDDMFIFSNSKDELKLLLEEINVQLAKVKLEVNEKKTHITKLSHGFTFMQIKYSIDGNKIVKRPTREKIARERRRLKKFKSLYDNGRMTELDIHNCYKSWKNSITKDCNRCSKSIANMDRLYDTLFPNKELYSKKSRSEYINNIFNKEYGNEILGKN